MSGMISDALFSDCGTYRYWLSRVWDEDKPLAVFIGANPSKAGAELNDATIVRLIGFCTRWGYGGFVIVNVAAYVATTQDDLNAAIDPVGPDNDKWIDHWCKDRVPIAMWGDGAASKLRNGLRLWDVKKRLGCEHGRLLLCFGKTKGGAPKHPVRLSYETKLVPYP